MRNLIYWIILCSGFLCSLFVILGITTFSFSLQFAIHYWIGSGIWLVISLLLCLGLWIQKKFHKED